MIIQDEIDALPPQGGIVHIPVGDWSEQPRLILRDNVILAGQGNATVIPALVNSTEDRIYGCGLRDLIVDACHCGGYAIDWRQVSQSHTFNVVARGGTYALVMIGDANYNSFMHSFFNGSVVGAELYSNANSNTFVGCKFSAPTGLSIIGCNGNTLLGGALESHHTNMVFKAISGDGGTTHALGVRQEDANHSSTYWNQ